MEPWPSNPMQKLYADYFNFHFTNQLTPKDRNGCYICYEVRRTHRLISKGVFENQPSHLRHVYLEEPLHAEQRFLSWFSDTLLCPDADYHVTWFMSWSPCFECAEEVVKFLGEHGNVSLSISASRLYIRDHRDKQGIRRLSWAGAELAVMCPEDFRYCWDNFVDNGGWPFRYWESIRRNYHDLEEKLHEMVCKPMNSLPPKTYIFNFRNLLSAPGQISTYICFQVEERKYNSPNSYYWGVFQNQPSHLRHVYLEEPLHAEQRFLSWFSDTLLCPDADYHVTWFMSWSPCFECAEEVVKFLGEHGNVSLSISASRLYIRDHRDKQGIRRLSWAGAELAVMCPEDFRYCWDNFVDNGGWPFRYWESIRRNYHDLEEKLHEMVCKPMNSLPPKTYIFNFRNLLSAPGQISTYICFQVEERKYNSPNSYYWGVFQNQPSHLRHVYLEEPLHAEQRFLSWFSDTLLCPDADYHVTWFMSWSPCFECAEEVVKFLGEHGNVSLSISASRLYIRDHRDKQGIRRLSWAGAELAVMCPEDFRYCWDNFVDNGGWPFRYWESIRRNYHDLEEKLHEMVCKPMNSLPPKTYIFNFRNLLSAPGQISTYICFQVEERKYNSPNSYYWGVFQNQPSHLRHVYLEEPLHAEQRFLSWFSDTLLCPDADYHVTWFMSWSPCFECAEEVVKFLGEHGNVSLSISASRLYIRDHRDKQGIRRLSWAGAELAVMCPEDFRYCWDNFVDNGGWPFRYWESIRRNYHDLEEKLHEMVCKPMNSLPPKTYIFNFRNLLSAPGQISTYICFQVEERKYNSPNSYYWGVFQSQPSHLRHVYLEEPLHAEQRFLSWFSDTLLCPDADYHVTWFMSWSPCFECAEEVVKFLGEHGNVSLSISASRLYIRDHRDKQGIRRLSWAGAELAVMCPEDFRYCWDNFVDNGGWPFRYWESIRRNYHDLEEKLHEMVCKPMNSLPPKTYIFNFRNLLSAPGQISTYICFQVEERKYNSPNSYYWGVFQNQPSHLRHVYLEEPLHAEQRFLSWFSDTLLCPDADYHVTWFMSWSPCFECAEEVVKFLGEHGNVSLSISASRLYIRDHRDKQGIRRLSWAGAELAVMCPEDFRYCWDNFVDNGGWPFRYWESIRRNYHDLEEKLHEMVCKPMNSLPPKTYIFNFRNLLSAPGQISTYICFQVEERKYNSPNSYYWGVFQNQPSHLRHVYLEEPLHAEQRFLSWFSDTLLCPDADYHVTWFMSWSPCFECAEEVVKFLGEHGNVSLSISASRLYIRDHRDKQGIRRLSWAGAELAVMCPEDFRYCWDNFVDNGGWPFRYWESIRRNYHDLEEKLHEMVCKPMNSLPPKTYIFNFRNLLSAPGQISTYICFQVEERKYNSPNSYYWGVFQNQPSHLRHVYLEEPLHAEQRFLSWFSDTLLCPDADYHVTWFMSWSPCFECAEEVVKFLGEHGNVSLSISASRLYIRDHRDKQGIRRLSWAGAELAVMCPEDFRYCWDNFVDNGGWPFRYWESIRRNYHDLEEKLHEMVCKPMNSLPPKTYIFNFRNLLSAPGQISTYICFQVEERKYNSPNSYYWGVFQNQPSHLRHVYLEEPLHAEQRFLSWFSDTLLCPDADYHVTWFMSWSPCFECAEEVVKFLGEHGNVSLSISASRLYIRDHRDKQGIRRLSWAGAELAVMCPEDFRYCWDNFVDNGGWPFRYWESIRRNYHDLEEKLHEMVCFWMNQLGPHPDFNELQTCRELCVCGRPALAS